MLREKQLRDRMYTVRRSWIKSRDDLSVRIRAVLLQAKEMAEQRRLEAEQQRTQNEICLILREQVNKLQIIETRIKYPPGHLIVTTIHCLPFISHLLRSNQIKPLK